MQVSDLPSDVLDNCIRPFVSCFLSNLLLLVLVCSFLSFVVWVIVLRWSWDLFLSTPELEAQHLAFHFVVLTFASVLLGRAALGFVFVFFLLSLSFIPLAINAIALKH